MPRCPDCSQSLSCVTALWLHLSVVHRAEKCSQFRCSEPGCFRVCPNWSAFRRHLLSIHYFSVKATTSVCGLVPSSGNNKCSDTEWPADCPQIADEPMEVKDSKSCANISSDLILQFAAKLYADHKLPRSHVQEVIQDVRDLLSDIVCNIKPIIAEKLSDHSLSTDSITDVVTDLDSVLEPFSSLSTEYRRLKALKESGCFIPVDSYVIGDRVDDKMVRGIMVKENVSVHAKFIPLRNVLQKVFSLPGVLNAVETYMDLLSKEDELIENFVQGKLWKKKVQEHFEGKFVVPLFVYFDDFEVNNPLGTHAGIQKLGAVYYSVACFPPEVNSLLENIFLAALFHSSDRVTFTNHRIFHKIINELNFLQREGVLIETENGSKRVHFGLGLVLGDNLGLNSILGFVESFNAHYYCRLCKTSKDDAQHDFTETNLRVNTYENDVLLQDYSLTGIKERSVWNGVDYFQTELNFVVDWLHDGPEGWFASLMGHIVHYFHNEVTPKDVRLSLNVLNGRLNSFDYYHNSVSNKPPLLSQKEVNNRTTKMSGSEMQNFILMFSMLVGDLVPQNDDVWKLYSLMRQIMDIVMCRRLLKGHACLLRTLVTEHLILFKKLFPNERVKPKGHNFTHYGTVLEQSGPLINLTSIRFEGKHKDKKREANATSSRKNITQTLCVKEQLGLCYRLMCKKGFTPCDDSGAEECLEHVSYCDDYVNFIDSVPSEFDGTCVQLNWAKVCGITYRHKTCVVIRLSGEDELLPVFGCVEKILQNDEGNICLVCRVVTTSGFDFDYHAYDVEFSEFWECVRVKDLVSPFPVMLVRLGSGSLFATVRHKL